MLAAVPVPARLLGLAGLLPFWVATLVLVVGSPELHELSQRALIGYGAVILTFLGAVHWGIALRVASELSWERLGWSVTPSLAGWAAQLIDPVPALILLVLGLWGAFVIDLRALRAGLMPAWYLQLRRVLSLGAITALGLALVVGMT